jgi:hypothetical protein
LGRRVFDNGMDFRQIRISLQLHIVISYENILFDIVCLECAKQNKIRESNKSGLDKIQGFKETSI